MDHGLLNVYETDRSQYSDCSASQGSPSLGLHSITSSISQGSSRWSSPVSSLRQGIGCQKETEVWYDAWEGSGDGEDDASECEDSLDGTEAGA